MSSGTTELPLFAFGTLRRGKSNHALLDGRYVGWFPAVLHGYRRTVSAHGFPAILPAAGNHVIGEVFEINPNEFAAVLEDCDRLESITPGTRIGPYYHRVVVTVTLESGPRECWAYVDPATSGLNSQIV